MGGLLPVNENSCIFAVVILLKNASEPVHLGAPGFESHTAVHLNQALNFSFLAVAAVGNIYAKKASRFYIGNLPRKIPKTLRKN